jgi:hypothetical protein
MMKASCERKPERDCGRNGAEEPPLAPPELVLAADVFVDVAATAAAVAATRAAAVMFVLAPVLDIVSVVVRALFGWLCLAEAETVSPLLDAVSAPMQ